MEKQVYSFQPDCVDCAYYDGFGQCIQHGDITEEVRLSCEFKK